MKAPFYSFCLGFFALLGLVVSAVPSAVALDCNADNLPQTDQLTCRHASLRWMVETIEKVLEGLAGRVEPETGRALTQEHRAWEIYRDQRCNTQGFQVLEGPEVTTKTRCIRQEAEERLVVLAHRLQGFFETQTSLLGPRDRSILTALTPNGLYHVQDVFFVHADAAGGGNNIQALKRETLLINHDRLIFNGEICVRPITAPYGVDVEQFFSHFYGQGTQDLMPNHPMPKNALVLELDCVAGAVGPKNLLLIKEPGVIGLVYHDTAYIEFRFQN